MAYGRVVFVLGAQIGLEPIVHFCEGVRNGKIPYNEGSVPNSKGRLSDAEILGVLTQVFQLENFLATEEIEVSWSFLGAKNKADITHLGRIFGSEISPNDVHSTDALYELDADALVFVPLDVHAAKQVEQLARLSMVLPRIRHLALTASPKWNHSQLMALKESWEWLDPRQASRLQHFAEEIIRMNGGITRKEIQNIDLPQKTSSSSSPEVPAIITRSNAFKEIIALVDAVADSDSTVLISGESGTGKELIANRIHMKSHRAAGPQVAVNCGAIPSELLESELFGHVKGAFTGAVSNREGRFDVAEGGTLFLDEIGEMGAGLQVKLLRVLQTKKYEPVGSTKSKTGDVRIVAATNRDLELEVQEGRFREDLFYRLNVIPVLIPPLRSRKEDIQLLSEYFIKKFNREKNRRVTGITRAALRSLAAYEWPGNVRELENLMERMVILKSSGMIDILDFPEKYRKLSLSDIEYEDLMNPKPVFMASNENSNLQSVQPERHNESRREEPTMKNSIQYPMKIEQSANGIQESQERVQNSTETQTTSSQAEFAAEGGISIEEAIRVLADRLIFPEEGLDFNSIVDQFENILILQALERTGWNRNRAAGLLRLNRTTLVEKLKKKQLVPPMRFDNRTLSGNA
jgi:transcriptional regulator with PAS, ATPase and Fis domain